MFTGFRLPRSFRELTASSKPGAAAMSIWLSNKCIGLNPQGYGALLSEVSFTCTRVGIFFHK